MSPANTDIDDVRSQARQGSIAAIIQVLNEALVDDGIRTRAVIADGMLQLLCEASTAEQLPQEQVVAQVQTVLEDLSPRHIRHVNINSRLVREQQLLWFEEITRDPDKHLLWSQVVALKQPHPLVQLRRWWQRLGRPQGYQNIPKGGRIKRRAEERQLLLWRGVMGGASLCLLLLLVGWAFKDRLGFSLSPGTDSATAPPSPAPPQQDPFVQAIRIAEQAANDGQTATTAADWLDLAARWQRASDLMAEVPVTDPRATTAESRVTLYQDNSEQALARSRLVQQEGRSPEGEQADDDPDPAVNGDADDDS